MPRVQNKRGTNANLTSVNPTPLAGELLVVTDENTLVVGNGTDAYSSLSYVTATPRSHTHGNITNAGAIGSTANLPLITTTSGVITVGSFGTAANTFCQGNDSRLSDARTPIAHVHSGSDITSGTVAYARLPVGSTTSTVCAGDDARLSDARTPTSHTHPLSQITDLNIASAGSPAVEYDVALSYNYSSATWSTKTIGNVGVGSQPIGGWPGGSLGFALAGKASTTHVHAATDVTSGTFDIARIPTGTTSSTVCVGNDARLSDTRTPTDGSVTTAKIADDAVTYDKLQNVSATDRLLGRSSSGAGDVQEITCTAFGRSLIDDADAAAGRTTLGAAPTASPTFTGVVTVAAGTASAPSITVTGDTNTGLLFPAADIIAVSTGGLERLRVNGAGNLMVGAPGDWATGTTAQAAVDIRRSSSTLYSGTGSSLGGAANAALTVRNVSSTAGSWAALVLQGQRDDGEIQAVSIGAVTQNDSLYQPHLVFTHRTSSGGQTERMRIANGGNVGIATQTPESRLHVAGVITVSAGTAALPALVPSGDANTGILFPAADTVAISTAGSERVRVKDNGVVRYVPLATEPSTAEAGDLYYHSGLRRMRMYNGFRWQSLAVSGQEWNVSAASYVRSFSVAGTDDAPTGVFFKPDGLKMYIIGNATDSVHEYDLKIAWDISTAAFAQSLSVAAQDTSPSGVVFKPDGLKMYVAGDQGNDINEYTLSTAWDISTATFVQAYVINSQEASIAGIHFRDDGVKMYMTGVGSDNVNEYTLSTAWDVSTATFVQAFSVAGQETAPHNVFFKPDGRRMYVVGATGDDVTEYDLSTAWDISTATHTTERSVQAQDNDPRCVFFRPDGLMMYIVGVQNDQVHQYTLQ